MPHKENFKFLSVVFNPTRVNNQLASFQYHIKRIKHRFTVVQITALCRVFHKLELLVSIARTFLASTV